jgi:hypothetical protein
LGGDRGAFRVRAGPGSAGGQREHGGPVPSRRESPGWFQADSPGRSSSAVHEQDFLDIKSLGCDVIRLPINLHFMTNGSPDYTLDPLFLEFSTRSSSGARSSSCMLLDNHTFDVTAAPT